MYCTRKKETRKMKASDLLPELPEDGLFGKPLPLTPEQQRNAKLNALQGWSKGAIAMLKSEEIVGFVEQVCFETLTLMVCFSASTDSEHPAEYGEFDDFYAPEELVNITKGY